MALVLNIGKCTLLGNIRENNEDAIDVSESAHLTVSLVADGMGGQAAGEIASKRATEIVPRELQASLGPAASVEECQAAIKHAVLQANDDIITRGSLDRDYKNMGTTIVLAVWRHGPEMCIAGLGDSRAYLIRDNTIRQLTVDHSLAQALVENKTISAAEARDHRYRNVLWKYLGSKEVGEGPEVQVIPIQAGDKFLLCTDGLTTPVPDEQILQFIQQHPDVQECADGLGQLALDSGSRDNVS